jgi:polysaccharide export outer membrane protein
MFKILILIFISIQLVSCTTPNLLMEPTNKQTSAVSSLDTTFRYNPNYEYTIRKNDKISISVWGQDELSVGSVYGVYNSNEIYGKWLMVDNLGNIEIPKIGQKKVINFSLIQLKDSLRNWYGTWILNPIVDVKVLNKEITILGEVKAPQTIVIDKDRITLFELIGKCGGFDFYADLKYIKIVRQKGEEVITSNLNLTRYGDYLSKNIYLLPGDVVIVNSKKHKDFDKRISTIVPFTATISAFAVLYKLLGNK